MLNIDCFKSLCMTPQGKEIRKYYVKLENIYNKMIKKQIEENTTTLKFNFFFKNEL
jgi:phage anti-repressor protein